MNLEFDEEWYIGQYPHVSYISLSPQEHFLKYGKRLGYLPHADAKPDVQVISGIDALENLHTVYMDEKTRSAGHSKGVEGGIGPTEFDEGLYLKLYPDVAVQFSHPGGARHHYTEHGSKEFRTPYVDTVWYLEEYSDIKTGGVDPKVHYVEFGHEEGRHPFFDAAWYVDEYFHGDEPEGPVIEHYRSVGRDLGFEASPYGDWNYKQLNAKMGDEVANVPHVKSIIKNLKNAPPIRCYFTQEVDLKRVNIVTDSIGPSSLFGGVGTGIIIGALLATRLGAALRIVTRTEMPDPSVVPDLLKANGVIFKGDLEAAFLPIEGKDVLQCHAGDIFITTSWWTTQATHPCVPEYKLIYLLQEDERLFYPSGDQSVMATEFMYSGNYLKIINTKLLYDHLISSAPSSELVPKFIYFEPAFPNKARREGRRRKSNVHKIFFYARPNNARNLFLRGVEALDAATSSGVLNGKNCELHFVGRDVPKMKFSNDVKAVFHEPMPWASYKRFLASMSGGFVLMSTPHPSYPPLDLASIGVPVLTNKYGLKQGLQAYSNLIICKDLGVSSLVEGFQELIDRIESPIEPKSEIMESSWEKTLDDTISRIILYLNRGEIV